MKIRAAAFKGEVPKTSSRLLPEGFAADAVNCKLTSGDLEAWNESTAVATLSPSGINSIYKMQTGSNIFLRSQNDVNWIKGAIAADEKETIYFTGFPDNPITPTTAAPKVTTAAKATGVTIHTGQTAGHYPNDWLLLGVPTPTTGPGGISEQIGVETVISDGSSLTGWTTTGTIVANNSRIDATTIKMTHSSEMYQDISIGNKAQDAIKFQFQLESVESSFIIRFGCDSLGNGPAISIGAGRAPATGVQGIKGYVSFGTSTTWAATPTFTKHKALPFYLLQDVTYNVEISLVREAANEFSTDPLGDFKIVVRISGNTPTYTTQEFKVRVRSTEDAIRQEDFSRPVVLERPTDPLYTTQVRVTGSTVEYAQTTEELTKVLPQGTFVGFKTLALGPTTPHDLYLNNIIKMFIQPTDDKVSTAYVYTWINELGEEGPPSPVSTVIEKSNGLRTTISGINDPTSQQQTDYGLTNTAFGTKRLYRAATGGAGETNFFFVTDIDYGTTTYIDNVEDFSLGETLQSMIWETPPTDGHSIISLPNGITMLASKNEVYPSVQNRPHAYPADYALATDFDVVGLGAIDTTVVVLTEANPYLIFGSDPALLSMSKLEIAQGCVSKKSIAHIEGFGVIYASPDGLVVINGATAPTIVTKDFFTREQWQALVPSSIKAYVHDSRYIFFYDTGSVKGGYLFDFRANGTGLVKLDLTQQTGYNNAVTAGYSDPLTDIFYYVHTSNLLASWNTSASKLIYRWKSKVYQMPLPITVQAAQVRASSFGSGITFKAYADGTLFYTKTITTNIEFVLPKLTTEGARELQFELTGTGTVLQTELAETMEELT